MSVYYSVVKMGYKALRLCEVPENKIFTSYLILLCQIRNIVNLWVLNQKKMTEKNWNPMLVATVATLSEVNVQSWGIVRST